MNKTPSSLWSLPLERFSLLSSSTEPTPGAGSVAIVAGVLGCDLLTMAVEISHRKEGSDPRLADALEGLSARISKLKECADADVRAFSRYMAVSALPMDTEQERAARDAQLKDAAVEATQVPLRAAPHMVAALRIADSIVDGIAPAVVSDVGSGCALIEGALRSLFYTVDNNLKEIRDGGSRQIREQARTLKEEAEPLSQRMRGRMQSILHTPVDAPRSGKAGR